MAAVRVYAELIHRPQLAHDNVPLRRIAADVFPGAVVRAGEEQVAIRRKPVAAGASGFLLVMLDGFGHGRVYYETYIGTVYAHAERDGGDYQRNGFLRERILVALALFFRHTRVVGKVWKSQGIKFFRYLVHVGTPEAVDY